MTISIPEMTRAQEAKFWETHDATDYLDETEPVTVTVGPRPRNRCSVCGEVLLSRYVDIELAGGRAQLRQLRQLYCPAGVRKPPGARGTAPCRRGRSSFASESRSGLRLRRDTTCRHHAEEPGTPERAPGGDGGVGAVGRVT